MTSTVEEVAVPEEAVHAARWLDVHGLPTGREEPWRYTPVDALRQRLELLATGGAAAPVAATLDDVDGLTGRHGGTRIVVVDGVHVPERSSEAVPAGLWFGTARNLSPTMRQHLTTPLDDPPDGFEALNRVDSTDVVYLLVADDAVLDDPVHVVHVSTGARTAHPRVVVDVGTGARLHLVESHVGLAGDGFTNASTTAHLARDAALTLHRVQDEPPPSVHVGRLHVRQQAGARAELRVLSRGGETCRLATHVELVEPGATCRITGLLAPRPGARHDHVATIDHAASRTTSELDVRAVVPERARTSSTGHVIVRSGTVGTVAHQRSDSLLLHPSAQADNRPWLEIFADDLRAEHGSATGRLDEDALFYLRSRGIPRAEARAVLVGAFARAVVEQVEPASLRAEVAGWFDPEEELT